VSKIVISFNSLVLNQVFSVFININSQCAFTREHETHMWDYSAISIKLLVTKILVLYQTFFGKTSTASKTRKVGSALENSSKMSYTRFYIHSHTDTPGVKWPRREADHSPPSSTEVKNSGAIPPHLH
jgi:hypothetical protein